MDDLGRAHRRLEVGLRAFERQTARGAPRASSRDGVGVTIVTHRAAGSRRRSCPGCSAPCRRRARGPARCRDAASRRWLTGGSRRRALASVTRKAGSSNRGCASCHGFISLSTASSMPDRLRRPVRSGELEGFRAPVGEPVRAPVRDDLGRPAAHGAAVFVGRGGHPGQLLGEFRRRRAGRTGCRWCRRAPARAWRRSRLATRPGAASRSRRPRWRRGPRARRARQHECAGVGVPARQLIGLEEAGPVDRRLAAAARDRLVSIWPHAGPSPQRTRSQAGARSRSAR